MAGIMAASAAARGAARAPSSISMTRVGAVFVPDVAELFSIVAMFGMMIFPDQFYGAIKYTLPARPAGEVAQWKVKYGLIPPHAGKKKPEDD